MNKKQILDAYNWRHACKEFDATRKISAADFDFLLETIRLSPSSFGLQPYEVLVLQNSAVLNELHPHMWGAQKQLPTASHTILFVTKKDITVADKYFEHILCEVQKTPEDMCDMRRKIIGNHLEKEIKINENRRFLDEWAARQAYIALGNVMSAAAEIAIDSCPIEGFAKAPVSEILQKHGALDTKLYEATVFCSFGYRLNPPAREKTRKPLSELVRYI
jgi:nitroreductase